jgi:hypothetical protein
LRSPIVFKDKIGLLESIKDASTLLLDECRNEHFIGSHAQRGSRIRGARDWSRRLGRWQLLGTSGGEKSEQKEENPKETTND